MNQPNLHSLRVAMILAVVSVSTESGAGGLQYQWENEQGKTEYSDRPPPAGVDYNVIDTQPGLQYVEPEEPLIDETDEPAAGTTVGSSEKSGDIEKNPGLCEKSRMNLIALQSQTGLTVRNEKGEARQLSPEDVEFAIQNAERQIELHCD